MIDIVRARCSGLAEKGHTPWCVQSIPFAKVRSCCWRYVERTTSASCEPSQSQVVAKFNVQLAQCQRNVAVAALKDSLFETYRALMGARARCSRLVGVNGHCSHRASTLEADTLFHDGTIDFWDPKLTKNICVSGGGPHQGALVSN